MKWKCLHVAWKSGDPSGPPQYVVPLSNFHSTPTFIAELPFYTHFEHCTCTSVIAITVILEPGVIWKKLYICRNEPNATCMYIFNVRYIV